MRCGNLTAVVHRVLLIVAVVHSMVRIKIKSGLTPVSPLESGISDKASGGASYNPNGLNPLPPFWPKLL